MIFGLGFSVVNIDNKIQISISEDTEVGQRIKREGEAEYTKDATGTQMIVPHPDYNFLIKNNVNYFLLGGHIKIRYEWDKTSKFQNEHKETYMSLLTQQQEGLSIPFDNINYNHGDGFMEHEVKHANRSKTWLPSPLPYEPYCTNAEVMVMQKDTVILCPMQHAAGWTFEHIDVERAETIESNKQGQDMYIVFGMRCTVGDKQINQFEVKKQTTTQLQITNASYNLGTLVRIYK